MGDDSETEKRLERLEESVEELEDEIGELRDRLESESGAPRGGDVVEANEQEGTNGAVRDQRAAETEGGATGASSATDSTESNMSVGGDARAEEGAAFDGRVESPGEEDGDEQGESPSTDDGAGDAPPESSSGGGGRDAEESGSGGTPGSGDLREQEDSGAPATTRLLNYVGIALVFLGVIFLFDYAIERGWLTEWVRVVAGAVLGTGLVGGGVGLRDERQGLASVLAGGGIATFYATLFGAFQLYELIPFAVAFALMVGVTMLTFVLALAFESVGLAMVGMVGGYATPFLLTTGSNDVVGLVTYASVVTVGTSTLYVVRRWRSILAAEVVGHWLVVVIGLVATESLDGPIVSEKLALQLSIVVGWLTTGVLPIVREVLAEGGDDQDSLEGNLDAARRFVDQTAVIATPLIAFGVTQVVWEFSDVGVGLQAAGLAVLYAGGHAFLRARGRERFASNILWIAVFGTTVALLALTEGKVLEVGLAVEALSCVWLGDRFGESVLRTAAGVVGLLALGNVGRFLLEEPTILEFVTHAVALSVVFWTSRRFHRQFFRVAFGALIYAFVLRLLEVGLGQLPNGQAWVTGTWTILAFSLIGWGAHTDDRFHHSVGFLVLALVVGKLFLVDLAEVDALWRIFLFIGVGALFLGVSYLFPEIVSLDEPDEGEVRESRLS